MPHRGIVWVDSAPTIRIDGDGVELCFSSGDLSFVHRLSRANLRKLADCATDQLNRQDARERLTLWKNEVAEHQAASGR